MNAGEKLSISSGKKPCYILLTAVLVGYLIAGTTFLLSALLQRRGSNEEVHHFLLKLNKQNARVLELERRISDLEKKDEFLRPNARPSIRQTNVSSEEQNRTSIPVDHVVVS